MIERLKAMGLIKEIRKADPQPKKFTGLQGTSKSMSFGQHRREIIERQ